MAREFIEQGQQFAAYGPAVGLAQRGMPGQRSIEQRFAHGTWLHGLARVNTARPQTQGGDARQQQHLAPCGHAQGLRKVSYGVGVGYQHYGIAQCCWIAITSKNNSACGLSETTAQ